MPFCIFSVCWLWLTGYVVISDSVPFTDIQVQQSQKNLRCKRKMQSGHLARRRRSRQEHAEILQKIRSLMIICSLNSVLPASQQLYAAELSVFWGSVTYACWYKLFFLWSCHSGANTFSCLQWNVLCVHLHFLSVFNITPTCCTYCIVSPCRRIQLKGGHWQGYSGGHC